MGAERVMLLTSGALCKGYGGLELAAEAILGPLEHLWYAENDPHASTVCAAHWPGVPNLGDLTAIDWTRVPQVDVLTAGFPCQDVSCAGKRAGLVADRWDATDAAELACGCFPMNHKVWCQEVSPLGSAPADGRTDEESLAAVAALNERDRAGNPEWLVKGSRTGVWSYIADAIRELRPKIVLLENVRGLLSARADSDVEPCPWCVGDDRTEPVVRALGAVLADLADLGFDAEWTTVAASAVGAPHRRERVFIAAWPSDCPPDAAGIAGRVGVGAAGTDGVTLLPTPRASDTGTPGRRASEGFRPPLSEVLLGQLLPTPRALDSTGVRGVTPNRTAEANARAGITLSDVAFDGRWGDYAPAIARWETATRRAAPEPTEPGSRGQQRLSPAFVEWLMGLPAGWVTDQLPRNPALKCLGNGAVWQQAAHAYTDLLGVDRRSEVAA